ncbi:hypothetical protein PJW08_09185 [Tenacibaculum finnmarkense]|nr:hypothetical protein PJW08_09185 [Tenacibaculum finnmarkense]
MTKTYIKFIAILILLSNCENKKGKNKISIDKSLNNTSRKIEINSEQLYKNAISFFNNKKLEESKKELLILKYKFPNSKERNKTENLLKSIDLEFKKAEKKELQIEKENREKKERKFLKETKSLRKKTDKLEGTSWYQDKNSPKYINKNGFYLYIASSGFSYPSLRLKIQYKDKEWLFIKKYQIFVDGIKYSIEPEYGKIKRDNGNGGIWEWLDIGVGKDEFEILTAIKNANDIKIRYISDKYQKNRTLTITEKKAIINILNVYSKIGGEIY